MGRSRSTLRAVVVVVAALGTTLLGSTAHAAAAAGGTGADSSRQTEAWIAAEAEYLSGRKLVVVCAAEAEEWRQALTAVGLGAGSAERYYGFSLIERGEMYLSPYVCEGLRLGRVASTRRQNELQVSWSVDVLIHESVHLGRPTGDEALAEACARTGLPVELHRLYGLAFRSAELKRLSEAATWFRRTQPSAYQGGTCRPDPAR